MMTSTVRRLPLLLLLSCTGWSATAGDPTSCKTSGVVHEGSPAHITCIFNDKLRKVDQTFMVYRQKSARSSEVIVALCGWTDGELECRNFEGFGLKTEESNGQVIFEVESAQEIHSGTYICKTLPAAEAEATNCNLTVQKNRVIGDRLIECNTNSPVVPGEQASIFCTFPESVGMNGIILEKFDDNNGRKKDEIAQCEGDGKCVVKQGYTNDCKMPTKLKVNIPHVSVEHAGIYVCRSRSLPGVSGICMLALSPVYVTAETRHKDLSYGQLLVPMYAILGCFVVLLVIAGVAALWHTFCRRTSPTRNGESNMVGGSVLKHEGNTESKEALLITAVK